MSAWKVGRIDQLQSLISEARSKEQAREDISRKGLRRKDSGGLRCGTDPYIDRAVSARSGVGRAGRPERFFGVGRRLAETHSHNGIPCIPPFISLHRKKAHVVHDIYPKFPLVGNPGRVHDPKFFDGFHKSLFAIYTVTSHSMEMDVRFGSRFQHNAYHTISNNLPPNLLSLKEIQSCIFPSGNRTITTQF